jgi:hypothetical protein
MSRQVCALIALNYDSSLIINSVNNQQTQIKQFLRNMSFQFSFFGVCGRVNFRNARSCQGFSALVRRTRGPLVDSIHRRYHQQRCSPEPMEQFQSFFMTWSAHHNLQKFIILNVTSGCVANVRGVSPRVKNRKWSAAHLPYSSSSVHPPTSSKISFLE